MKHLRTEVEIDASAEQVWSVLTELEKFPKWNPFITRFEASCGKMDSLTS